MSAQTGAQIMLEIPPTRNPRKNIKKNKKMSSLVVIKNTWPIAANSNPKKATIIHFPHSQSLRYPKRIEPVIVPAS